MKENKKGISISGAILAAVGLCCALVLAGVFYAAMAYQLAGEDGHNGGAAAPLLTPAPLNQGMTAAQLYPGALLALENAQLISERAQDAEVGGSSCRVITRVYALGDGRQAEAVSAYPAAYLERMAQENYVPQLITGFTLAGMDAVYALSGDRCALYVREGACVYALFAPADEQTAYALGAAAYLEETP